MPKIEIDSKIGKAEKIHQSQYHSYERAQKENKTSFFRFELDIEYPGFEGSGLKLVKNLNGVKLFLDGQRLKRQRGFRLTYFIKTNDGKKTEIKLRVGLGDSVPIICY